MKTNITPYRFLATLAVVAGLLASVFVITQPQTASAATAGCYYKVGNDYVTGGSDCLGTSGYQATKCYVADAATGGKAPEFKEAACGSIKVVTAKSLSSTLGPTDGGAEVCGTGSQAVKISIKIGCTRKVANPILDALFALLRFLSVGVGVVLTAAGIVTGVQYSFSRGDPGSTAKAKAHLGYIVVALLIYLFSFALLNFLVPGGLLS